MIVAILAIIGGLVIISAAFCALWAVVFHSFKPGDVP